MNLVDDKYDFMLKYIEKVQEIEKKYDVSPEAVFDIECEIAAANYILEADDTNNSQFDKHLETWKQSYTGVIPLSLIYNAAKGLVTQLKDKGVTKENVHDYMDRRIAEFEDAAKVGPVRIFVSVA
jgi:hypothetical protein